MDASDRPIRRVLFMTTTSDFGGAELLLQELVSRLDRERFAPSVLSLTKLGRVGTEIRGRGIPTMSLELSATARLAELPRAIFAIARLLRRDKIDLIHAQLYRANVLACLAARLVSPRPRVVLCQHSLYAMTGKTAERMARLTAPLADRVVAVSPEVGTYVQSDMGVSSERVAVILNGVDGARFRPGTNAALRAELSIPDDALVVGCVGRLSHEKGLDVLVEAAATLRPDHPNLHFIVAGDGALHGELADLVAARGLDDRVHLLGARSDVAELYRAMDLFALPSRREALPLALLEAMASGLPIIASRVGGIPGVVGSDAAVLVGPDSPPELESALRSLIPDPVRRNALSIAARARFEQAFSVDTTVARHEALYLELLENRAN